MKRFMAFGSIVALMGAIGCTTTGTQRDYQADQPPPIVKDGAPVKEKLSSRVPPPTEPNRRVVADAINYENVEEQVRRLENNIGQERSTAMRPANRE